VNSFIATLGMSQVLSAIMLLTSGDQAVTGKFPSWFQNLTTSTFLGISNDFYYLLALAIAAWYLLEHTPVGRFIFATGGNARAARLAGVPTGRLVWLTLEMSAVIAGFAGVALASRVTVFSTDTGPSFLFPAFAAVFFGATQIKGRANVWGTFIAMFALATGVEGLQLTFFGIQCWITPLFNGAALVIAVIFASYDAGGMRKLLRLRTAQGPGEAAGEPGAAPAVPGDAGTPPETGARAESAGSRLDSDGQYR
jgi:ribose transport system permease protein